MTPMRNLVRASVALLAAASAVLPADLDERIRRVERGLQAPIQIDARPPETWTIAERMAFYKVPGVSVAVIARGGLEWARGYGRAAAEGGRPVDAETLFQAASISKHVASLVALRLVDEGKLSLDEDVNAKLRSWKVPNHEWSKTEKVTLRRLLNHSAGITVHGFPGYASGSPLPTLPQILDGAKPANTTPVRVDIRPGSRWRYSGGGYEIVQQLVIDVTGKPFPQLARELVFDPLGMTHSTFEQPLPERLRANAASAHLRTGATIAGGSHTYPELAAAGLWTTPSDLARIVMELQTGGRILKPQTQREMLTKLLGDYGLGLQLGEADGSRWFAHGGSNAGFRCEMIGYLEGHRGAIVMTNGDRGSGLATEILASISQEYGFPQHRPKLKKVVAVDPETLRAYAGTYRFGGAAVVVSVEDGRSYVSVGGVKTEILAESPTSFFTADASLPPLQFSREAGAVRLTINGTTSTRQ